MVKKQQQKKQAVNDSGSVRWLCAERREVGLWGCCQRSGFLGVRSKRAEQQAAPRSFLPRFAPSLDPTSTRISRRRTAPSSFQPLIPQLQSHPPIFTLHQNSTTTTSFLAGGQPSPLLPALLRSDEQGQFRLGCGLTQHFRDNRQPEGGETLRLHGVRKFSSSLNDVH